MAALKKVSVEKRSTPEFTTPMMKQYGEIKKKYQDCLLFFRMGDFYELFLEDAHIGSKVLGITLTSRPNGKDDRTPMAGVPYHAVDPYLAKLVSAGYKVAICEQVSLPDKYGIVDREVIRVVTPGTLLDEKALDKKTNNFIISISLSATHLGLTISDISTGYFATNEIEYIHLEKTLRDEISKLNPKECILSEELYNNPELLKILRQEKGLNIYCFHEWPDDLSISEKILKDHFQVLTLASFGIENKPLATNSAAALLRYLQETQKSTVTHINKLVSISEGKYLEIDRSTMINLELFSTIREHDTRGTLLSTLDETLTAMGGRLLKNWISKPLTDKDSIMMRLDTVDYFRKSVKSREYIREYLKQVGDIERIFSKLAIGLGNARDLVNLQTSLDAGLETTKFIKPGNNILLKRLKKKLNRDLEKVSFIIKTRITDNPPISLRDGGIVKPGINKELDLLKKSIIESKEWIENLEQIEKDRTHITSLKVRFNKVFGYYIEISKSYLDLVPENYIRKQTLVNCERFITEELKEKEEIVLTTEEKINELEYKIFQETLQDILRYTKSIQNAASAIATLDCLTSFSLLADLYNYSRPKIIYSGEIKIKQGRHPVVERLLEDKPFVPNDLLLDNISQSLLIITGPNMAGKSVFIRQVAITLLMMQIGCFVPASSAHLSIVDRIFVRSGASDVITSGLSTFMVEMVETAHILHHATKNSLIIMDEIGRGTSTYDGISIAWAVAEYLATHYKTPPKTLFATHYHELQELEKAHPKKIKNYHMATENTKDSPVFLHTLIKGPASHSFGVAVAKLAGIPDTVIDHANRILANLENRDIEKTQNPTIEIVNSEKHTDDLLFEHLVLRELASLDIHTLTPLDALNKLSELKNKVKIIQSETQYPTSQNEND